MTKTYTEVLEAIQKANPELMKLELGCKIIAPVTGIGAPEREPYETTVAYLYMTMRYKRKVCTVDGSTFAQSSIIEILGKEPQLQHVLKSLSNNEQNKGEFKNHRILIDCDGWIIQNNPSISAYNRLIKYNLSLPFSQQDESLYTFLHKILCQK